MAPDLPQIRDISRCLPPNLITHHHYAQQDFATTTINSFKLLMRFYDVPST